MLLSAAAGAVLLGSVEPETLQPLIVEEGPPGVDAGPVPHPLDQEFLDAVREDVLHPLPLRLRLVADLDRPVAPMPRSAAGESGLGWCGLSPPRDTSRG